MVTLNPKLCNTAKRLYKPPLKFLLFWAKFKESNSNFQLSMYDRLEFPFIRIGVKYLVIKRFLAQICFLNSLRSVRKEAGEYHCQQDPSCRLWKWKFGPHWQHSIAQLLQICCKSSIYPSQRCSTGELVTADVIWVIRVLVWDGLSFMTWCIILMDAAIRSWAEHELWS